MARTQRADLVLASGSRFRRQMLENAGVRVTVTTATVDEPAERAAMARLAPDIEPGAVALRLADLKALDVSRRLPQALVIGADQVLSVDGDILGKPENLSTARAQLMRLRGRTHTLPTAVVLAQDGVVVWRHLGVTTLSMRNFSDDFLTDYLAAMGETVTQTVGGYMLEGHGAQLFERIDGDYFTVIGLPLLPLLAELRARGVLAA